MINDKEYIEWSKIHIPSTSLQRRLIQNLKDDIQISINNESYIYEEPYIYQNNPTGNDSTSFDPTVDQYYLIQNVLNGNKKRAMLVAYMWYKYKYNHGFNTSEWPGKEQIDGDSTLQPAHIIYRTLPGGKIMVKNNNSNGENTYLEILSYENGMYAAMLPLFVVE